MEQESTDNLFAEEVANHANDDKSDRSNSSDDTIVLVSADSSAQETTQIGNQEQAVSEAQASHDIETAAHDPL